MSNDEQKNSDELDKLKTQTLAAVNQALQMVCLSLPYLSGLANLITITIDPRVATIGIFASGRMIVNSEWFLTLNLRAATFVVAHEILHLALQSHYRCLGSNQKLFNIAHDYIINDMLVQELEIPVPAGGLEWHGARHIAAETLTGLIEDLKNDGEKIQLNPWVINRTKPKIEKEPEQATSSMAAALKAAGLKSEAPKEPAQPDNEIAKTPKNQPQLDILDVLPSELEGKWFPGKLPGNIDSEIARALSLKALKDAIDKGFGVEKGSDPGDFVVVSEALMSIYTPPWEMALQQWLEAVAPGPRTYSRPSRRGADRTDLVLIGRKREGWIINIILDTSGSMSYEFPRILGAIAGFCESININTVRILQCDVTVTVDEYIDPEQLRSYTIAGLGGSDMSAAMLRLADDPEVNAAIVITDGYIDYPETPMPYNLLWVVTSEYPHFSPDYGRVIKLPQNFK